MPPYVFRSGTGGHQGRPPPPPLIPFLPQLGPGPAPHRGPSRPGPLIPFLPQLGTGVARRGKKAGHGRAPAPGSVGASFPKVLPGGRIVPGTPAKGSQAGTGPPAGPPLKGEKRVPVGAGVGPVPGYVPSQYRSWVEAASRQTGLPAAVVAAQINLESGFNPGATSPAGAQGIAQFIPSTFASYGRGSPYNAQDSLAAYVNFMNTLLHQFHGNTRDALAAYNAGAGNIGAGLGYANSILSAAGHSGNITVPGGPVKAPGPGQKIRLPGGGTITIPPGGLSAPGSGAGTPGVGGRGSGTGAGSGGGAAGGGGSPVTGPDTPVGVSTGTPSPGGGGLEPVDVLLPGVGLVELFKGAGTGLGDIGTAIAGISNNISKSLALVDWLFKPGSWIRILSGLGGVANITVGVYFMSHAGGSIPGPGGNIQVVPRPAALPLGIALTGFGGVLLFIAFHNLPSNVSTFSDFVGYVVQEIQTGASTAAGVAEGSAGPLLSQFPQAATTAVVGR